MEIRIAGGVLAELGLEAWLAAPPARRRRLADDLARACRVAGRPLVLTDHSSAGFPCLHDERSRATYVIIPSGLFAPGYPASKEDTLVEVVGELGVPPYAPYLNEAPWKATSLFRRSAEVTIGPMLLALRTSEAVSDRELEATLSSIQARLPTSVELEWAIRGPSSTLFPWGDQIPRWLVAYAEGNSIGSLEQAARVCGQDPSIALGAFGLLEPVTLGTWALPAAGDPELDAAFPLAFYGGAGQCAPWQACNEWMHWLVACEARQALGSYRAHRLRPALRFVPC